MLKIHEINNEIVKSRCAAAVKRYIGPNRQMTVDEAADITGITARTIDCYRNGGALPPLDNALKLAAAIDKPSFLNAVLELISYEVRKAMHPEHCAFEMMTRAADFLKELAEALKDDQRIDHVEAGRILDIAEPMMDELSAFIGLLRKRAGRV